MSTDSITANRACESAQRRRQEGLRSRSPLLVIPVRPSSAGRVPAVVDFFAGAGGFTRGALDAGAYVVCGIDCDRHAKATYESNNHNVDGSAVPLLEQRLEDLDPGVLRGLLEPHSDKPVVFLGGPPCQPFTNLRTLKDRSRGARDALSSFVDRVLQFLPRFVVVENVPGIRAAKYGTIWTDALGRLVAAGYTTRAELVDAKRYGVPQTRRRLVLVAALGEGPPWPSPTHGRDDYVTVAEAFRAADLPVLRAGERSAQDALHAASSLSPTNLARIMATPPSGGSRLAWPDRLQLRCYRSHAGHTDVYGRMRWNKPAPTLTTRFVSLSNGRFGHPEQHRAITPREGALLQTFRPDYAFLDPSREVNVVHIGNAVPPRLAAAFVRAIVERVRDPSGS